MENSSNGNSGAAAQTAPNGIWFQRSNGESVRFSEPMSIPIPNSRGFVLPALPGPGLYAILARDESIHPRPYRVIYFGESESIDESAREKHERFQDWCAAANGVENLYVAYRWMFFSSPEDRAALAAALIEHCRPQCNFQPDTSAEPA